MSKCQYRGPLFSSYSPTLCVYCKFRPPSNSKGVDFHSFSCKDNTILSFLRTVLKQDSYHQILDWMENVKIWMIFFTITIALLLVLSLQFSGGTGP